MAATLAARCAAAELVEKAGKFVEVIKPNSTPRPAAIGVRLLQRDKLSTGDSSRAVLRIRNSWNARVDEKTLIEITETGLRAVNPETLDVAQGQILNYSREEKGEFRTQTPGGLGIGTQTQLFVRVLPDGTTFMQVIEGRVEFSNASGTVVLNAGEAAESGPGSAPRKTPMIDVHSLLQWALYYPGVVEPDELGLTEPERRTLSESLAAYTQGDLPAALEAYPRGHVEASSGAKIYRAAVLLATGGVEDARRALQDVPTNHPGRAALERMLAAVLDREQAQPARMDSASEALAESYYQQSRRQLERARNAARRATELAPRSGFAWTRLAELEFSFGQTRAATEALERGLRFSPRNAHAYAVRGYLSSAANRIDEARQAFERAVELDGGLGNAWLGLGLTKIRQGRRAEGRKDLQTAAMVEPTRSFYYSYHGKALEAEGAGALAAKDFDLARQLDPHDPTPWLYSALQLQNENRSNAAIRNLQESIRLNGNRGVYRSEFLLDQDRSVRGANLAKIYQHAGMADAAVREATRAVEADYSNPSAHLFLANSFDALRDPRRIVLRHETAWFNELLLANLLAPVGSGPLSHFVSQQEYSKLLDSDGFAGHAVTEWRDDGRLDQQASLSATFGRLGAGLDFAYWSDDGTRPNNATIRRQAYGQLKYQLSEDDTLYARGEWEHTDGGDLRQNYFDVPGNAGLHFDDRLQPGMLLLGWNRQWAPGAHTLFVASRLAGDQEISAPATTQLVLERDPARLAAAGLPNVAANPDGSLNLSAERRQAIAALLAASPVTEVFPEPMDFATERDVEIHSAEIQHLWQKNRNLLLLGGRWQSGEFETSTRLDLLNPDKVRFFTAPAALQRVTTDFERTSVYGYDFFQAGEHLTLIAGATWDWIKRPENFRNPPVSERQVESERVKGKLGFTVSYAPNLIVRGLFAESLGGVTFDESVRLEPVQLAGFNQAFRTVISEDVAGSVEAPTYRTWGASIEGAVASRTWWALSGSVIEEDVTRTRGVFDIVAAAIFPAGAGVLPGQRSERLAYREETFSANVHRLVGNDFAVGASYRFTAADLRIVAGEIPVSVEPSADEAQNVTLHEVALSANWNAPSGWFARAEARGYSQEIEARVAGQPRPSPPGDRFAHVNAEFGRRFHRQRHQLSAGVLNLTDQDYRLNPLTPTRDLPRARTVFVRCRVSF